MHAALHRFVDEAKSVVEGRAEGAGSPVRLLPGEGAFAARVAALPSATEADAAALETARVNEYLLCPPQAGIDRRVAGRALTAEALVETGVAGLLLSDESIDVPALVTELAGYLAGPTIPLWRYALIDADMQLTTPVPVVDRWELTTPTWQELRRLVGVPSAARHVGRRSFDLNLYGGMAMLRRVDPRVGPRQASSSPLTHGQSSRCGSRY